MSTHRTARIRRIAALAALTLAALAAAPAGAQVLTDGQAKCANTMSKDFNKTASALAKDINACIKDFAKGGLAGTLEACTTADRDGKVVKATDKLEDDFTATCLGVDGDGDSKLPPYGATSDALAIDAANDKELDLFHDVFGSDLDAALVTSASDEDAAACQAAIAKVMTKCQSTKLKAYAGCKKDAIDAPVATESAFTDTCLGVAAASQPDEKGKIAKACNLSGEDEDKIRGAIAGKCAGVDLSARLPGCNTDDPEALHACIDGAVECRVCLALNDADGLARNCDLFDDGLLNASCRYCGNNTTEAPEQCDGTDDGSCPGECTSVCACPGPRDFTFDPDDSAFVLRGLGSNGNGQITLPLVGTIPFDVVSEPVTGALQFDIAEGQLPPAETTIGGGPITMCVFLVEDPELEPGVSGRGVINCTGADLTGSGFFEDPAFGEFVDHCVDGGDCDSAPNAGGGITHPSSGVFVPDDTVDPECDDAGNTLDDLPDHTGVCNGARKFDVFDDGYGEGDATFTLYVAFDQRGEDDDCSPPISPGAQATRLNFTTGRAEAGVMDRNAMDNSITANRTAAQRALGTPFSCNRFLLEGSTDGASLVSAFTNLDTDLSFFVADTVTAVRFDSE